MQKKVLGILAGVATAHAVLLVGLMAGGGCRQPEILGPHTYNDGPEFTPAPEKKAVTEKKPAIETVKKDKINPPKEVKPIKPAVQKNPVAVKPAAKPVKPVAPVKREGVTQYKVKRGDSLSVIAHRHGLKTAELAAYNNIPAGKYNSIREGQTLNIPAGGAYVNNDAQKDVKKPVKAEKSAPAVAANGEYVVKSGDALERIARRHDVSTDALARANNMKKTDTLRPGQKLKIPARGSAVVKDSAKKDVAKPAKPVTKKDDSAALDKLDADLDSLDPQAGSDSDFLTVSKDMAVEEFAETVMVDIEDIRRLNPTLPADGKLKKNMQIKIPKM